MRLIDADIIDEQLSMLTLNGGDITFHLNDCDITFQLYQFGNCGEITVSVRRYIAYCPTVKAIPIEWIEGWVNNNTKTYVNPKYVDIEFTDVPIDYYEKFTPYQVITMLEDWEKERKGRI